jgi:hypothetical protein
MMEDDGSQGGIEHREDDKVLSPFVGFRSSRQLGVFRDQAITLSRSIHQVQWLHPCPEEVSEGLGRCTRSHSPQPSSSDQAGDQDARQDWDAWYLDHWWNGGMVGGPLCPAPL